MCRLMKTWTYFTFEEFAPLSTANTDSDALQSDGFQFAILQSPQQTSAKYILTAKERSGFEYDFINPTASLEPTYNLSFIEPSSAAGNTEIDTFNPHIHVFITRNANPFLGGFI